MTTIEEIKKDPETAVFSFCKENKKDTIWWVDYPSVLGRHDFTFDKKTIFNLFKDYPHNLTKEQKEIFDKENPFWADFFKGRSI